jgi:DNA-binding transcriptional regulator YdaS (Cro superfamily)
MKLAVYLKQNSKTLTAFAAEIGEKVTTVHGWISGRRNPGLASLVAIERATNGAVRATDFLPATPTAADTSPSSAKAA